MQGSKGAAAPSIGQRILSEIRTRILSGEWPPGHHIPSEEVLSETYGCSRMTVNKAMTELARAGLIERRRRSGSFVRRIRSQAAVLEIHDVAAEVAALGLPYRYRLVARTRLDAGDTERDWMDGVPFLRLAAVHFADERPFCLEERDINIAAAPAAEHADFNVIAPSTWLLAEVPWSEAEHRIGAAAAGPVAAKLLDIAKTTACLIVERRTWSAGEQITAVRLTYPGDDHTLVARFAPAA